MHRILRMRKLSLFEKEDKIEQIPDTETLAAHDGDSPNQAGNAITIPLDTPPDGGYGWVVCFALGNMNGFTWGIAAVCKIF